MQEDVFPYPEELRFRRQRLPVVEVEHALHDAVDDPDPNYGEQEPADQDQQQMDADHGPRASPPEGADLPAVMRLEPGAGESSRFT